MNKYRKYKLQFGSLHYMKESFMITKCMNKMNLLKSQARLKCGLEITIPQPPYNSS